jgi:hypothetical protein
MIFFQVGWGVFLPFWPAFLWFLRKSVTSLIICYTVVVHPSVPLNLSSQLLLNLLRNFFWNFERSHYVDVHILKEPCPIIFKRDTTPGLWFFFEKRFVFAILALCRDAYYKGKAVPNCLKELWHRVKKVCGRIMYHLVVSYFCDHIFCYWQRWRPVWKRYHKLELILLPCPIQMRKKCFMHIMVLVSSMTNYYISIFKGA